MKLKILFIVFILLFIAVPKSSYAAEEKHSASSAVLLKSQTQDGINQKDNRAKILQEFLVSYNSPLASSAKTFVNAADTYQLDWRLLAAISGVESTFARFLPYNSYNAWGWGIYGDNMIYFKSYDEAIETISKALREKYIDKWGAENVYQIGRFYAASPTWASRVVYFMGKIDEFALKNPATSLSLSI
ncbi:glucosaminidase domain-containing protein [Candidatus Daviesbacteria bacterium]|nr:glucosaminidase domain-containing protein [Candidatus Daviesbacteria bacterium]